MNDQRESLLVILYFHTEPKVIFVLFFISTHFQVTKEDFMSFEHILCMDESNLRYSYFSPQQQCLFFLRVSITVGYADAESAGVMC